jgi:DNA polymerase-3 subunit epsilon
MNVPSPIEALDFLLSAQKKNLDDMPGEVGLYGLCDHFGQLHYFGMTDSDSFKDRIWHRHITGSEERSHKLACNYSVGRMWHDRKHPDASKEDGTIARKVRQAFIRRHCVFVCMPLKLSKQELKRLEDGVIDLAWPRIADWNKTRKRVATFPEPRDLVDEVIGDLGLGEEEQAALDRQNLLFEKTHNL